MYRFDADLFAAVHGGCRRLKHFRVQATVCASIAPVRTFTYDGIGNQTAELGRSISYTSYNKPSSITQGSATLFFSHDIDHQRFKQRAPVGTTFYFDAFGVHALELARPISDGARSLAERAVRDRTARDHKPRCQFL